MSGQSFYSIISLENVLNVQFTINNGTANAWADLSHAKTSGSHRRKFGFCKHIFRESAVSAPNTAGQITAFPRHLCGRIYCAGHGALVHASLVWATTEEEQHCCWPPCTRAADAPRKREISSSAAGVVFNENKPHYLPTRALSHVNREIKRSTRERFIVDHLAERLS